MEFKSASDVPIRVAKFATTGYTLVSDIHELVCVLQLLIEYLTDTNYVINDMGDGEFSIMSKRKVRRA